MKSPRSRPRQKSSRVLETRLSAYSAAGKAAVAMSAAVGATTVAHSQIVNLTAGSFTGAGTSGFFSPPLGNTVPGTAYIHHLLTFQVNALHPVSVTFRGTLWNKQHGPSGTFKTASGRLSAMGGSGFNFASVPGASRPLVQKLGFGDTVQGRAFNYGNLDRLLQTYSFVSGAGNFPVGVKTDGNFAVGVTGYAGFRVRQSAFSTGYHNYFGWLRIKVTADGNDRPNGFMLVPVNGIYGAYDSRADGAANITAGQIAAIPEPTSMAAGLALFALGAVGVREHRRRRQAAAGTEKS